MNGSQLLFVHLVAQEPNLAQMTLWQQVTHSGPIVTAVLLLLVVFSVVSWAIIGLKARQIRRAMTQSEAFVEAFWKASRIDEFFKQVGDFPDSPVAKVFHSGYIELSKVLKSPQTESQPGAELSVRESLTGVETVARALKRSATNESMLLERLIPFLATTGSTAPFIGLFGTVWGIVNAFHEIGATGNASLATVAPGISEALIATAAGLAAAIPAVIAYNFFGSRLRVIETQMDNFASDFLNIVERHLAKK